MNRVAATAAFFTLIGAKTFAQSAPMQPAVSIVVFDADPAAKIPADQRAAVADELAFMLVESGQYRVLDRAWLPATDGQASHALLREAASAAGVTYLVTGRLNRWTTRVPAPRPRGPIGHTGPIGGLGPGARGSGPAGALGRLFAARQPNAWREQTLTSLDVRVIDTSSGRAQLTFSHRHTGLAATRTRRGAVDEGLFAVVQQTTQALLNAAAQLSRASDASAPRKRSGDRGPASEREGGCAGAEPSALFEESPALAQDATPPASTKPTLAVMSFDTDRTAWMPPPHLGDTLAELLTDRLVATGQYRVLDRAWMTPEADSHGRPSFDVFCERAVAAGVDYAVAGAVTRFSTERRSSTGAGLLPVPLVGGLIRRNRTESIVGLTLRIIDVRTGEVIATATAESGASASTKSGGGVALAGKVPVIGGRGSRATGLLDGLVDEAVQEAVTDAAAKIRAAVPGGTRFN